MGYGSHHIVVPTPAGGNAVPSHFTAARAANIHGGGEGDGEGVGWGACRERELVIEFRTPSEALMQLITASCNAGPGTRLRYTLEICTYVYGV
jgi:hypothetical protein